MGYPTVMTDVQIIGIGANLDVQPVLNQSWVLTMVGSDQWAGVVPNQTPQVDVHLFDGTNVAAFMQGANVRGWYRNPRLIMDNTTYARLTNVSGVQANISFSAELLRFSSGQTNCMSGLQAAVGAAATVSIRPATATQVWRITNLASDQWVGAAPAGLPNLTVEINDGTLAAMILSPTETRQWEPELELFSDNACYVDITNSAAVAAVVGWSAELYQQSGVGASVIRSSVQAAGVGANVDFRPVAGEEVRITMIGASRWVGVSPLMLPDMTAHIFDATNASQIGNSTNWATHGHNYQLALSRGNYLRCTNLGAGMNIAVSGELLQMYA